jgi:hypothetical protein
MSPLSFRHPWFLELLPLTRGAIESLRGTCNKVGVCQKGLYPATRLRCKMRPQTFQSTYHPFYQYLREGAHEGATGSEA